MVEGQRRAPTAVGLEPVELAERVAVNSHVSEHWELAVKWPPVFEMHERILCSESPFLAFRPQAYIPANTWDNRFGRAFETPEVT